MPLFEAGTTFLDFRAISIEGEKPKYFIGMNNADDDDDIVISFVFNTEHQLNKLKIGCNKDKQKFVIEPSTFNFIRDYTSIILFEPRYYRLTEIISEPNLKILEKTSDILSRQIKNCIDMNYIIPKFQRLIKDSFK